MKSIWIVDDDASIRFVLEKALERERLPTQSFTSASEVLLTLEALDDKALMPQVLVSDIRMPGGTGIELLKQLKAKYPYLPVIIMTAYSDIDSAVSAFQGGAFEYLPKPFDVNHAVALIRRAYEEGQREKPATQSGNTSSEMLGQAPAMQEVFRAIGKLSHSDATVMITGESGSGKELVAQALHKHSNRARGAFIAINTAAIPKDLLESELFGHERGAFTGAQAMRRGRFEQAEGGTLFLDEIGDMPLDLQTRLLRVLSDGHYYRIGGHSAIKTNVRIIAATHQDLEQRVKDGMFREDLFHRLNVIRLRLPALRERREDVPLLIEHFLQKSAMQLGVASKCVSERALTQLARFSYPGNVRQLENICHWLTVMTPARMIETKDLPPEILDELPEKLAKCVSTELEEVDAAKVRAEPSARAAAHPNTTHQIAVPKNEMQAMPTDSVSISDASIGWETILESEVQALLAAGRINVWDALGRRFEKILIQAALDSTRGRRIEAAHKLGIGRNTITRKIQELGLDS